MDINDLIRRVWAKWWLFLVFPTALAGLIFFLTQKSPEIYESSTTVYTGVASGQSFDVSGAGKRFDFNSSNNAFDNLILTVRSRETLSQVALTLMAQHISLSEPNNLIIGAEALLEIKKTFEQPELKKLVVKSDAKTTLENITTYHKENPQGTINTLMTYNHYYAPDKISERLKVTRKFTSDMLELVYESNDPGITKHTLDFLVEAFMDRHRNMRGRESASSVRYFEEQLTRAYEKLQDSEARLKIFISENGILNFYEQGKNLDIYRNDVEQEGQRAQRAIAGAESTLEKLEDELRKTTTRSEIIDSLAILREKTNQLRGQLLAGRLYGVSGTDREQKLTNDLNALNQQVQGYVSKLYNNDYTVDGIPLTQILQEWLNEYILRERERSALFVADETLDFINNRIDDFAPLGAELKKLEREVTVHENQYLSILHGLNMANLQKQSAEMSQSMEVVDKAYFPQHPKPSKRMFLVVAGFLAGVMLILALIILQVLLDNSIRTIDRAEAFSGLKAVGYFPSHQQVSKRKLVADDIDQIATRQLLSQIKVLSNNAEPYSEKNLLVFISSKPGEGKNHIMHLLANYLEKIYANVLVLSTQAAPENPTFNHQQFEQKIDFLEAESAQQLMLEKAPQKNFSYILMALPSYEENSLPIKLLHQAAAIFYVVDSKRGWTKSDAKFMSLLKNIQPHQSWLVLNKMDSFDLEEFLGDKVRSDSKLVKLYKKYFTKMP
jgi:uncharacterized protein involved in exopolysaccharide biosynthesis